MIDTYKECIRAIPDFPKKGILFRDITTLLNRKDYFKSAVDNMASLCKGVDVVAAIESRGFIFGSAIAYKLGAALVPIRKKGKLPAPTFSASYALEYGQDSLEIHKDAFEKGSRVMLVDDLLATGGTAKASIELIEKLGGKVAGLVFLVELEGLNGREKLRGYPVKSLVRY